jgi:hypothetical protein
MRVTALQSMLRQSLYGGGWSAPEQWRLKMRSAENTSEIRELTQDERMSVAGGFILTDIVNFAANYVGWATAKAARVTTLPAAGNGDCGPNHNGV